MRTAHAARSGILPLDARNPGRALVRVLAVVTLVAGILAMHSLSLGHGPMATLHSANSAHSPMTGTTPMVEGGIPALVVVTTLTAAAQAVAGGADPAHGMAAMCLAVLPLLVLLVARRLGWRIRPLAHEVRHQRVRGDVSTNRVPPAPLCPSLLELCIRRT